MQGSRRAALAVRRPLVWLAVTAVATVLLDQATKALVRTSIGLNEAVPVIPGVFDIAHVRNPGAAFGMLPGRRDLFVVVSLTMLAAVALYWWRERPTEWPVVVPLGLVVGGAVGNLIDRISSGLVTDLLAFSFFAPVFNLADSAIVVGVTCLVVWILFGPTPELELDESIQPAGSVEPRGAREATEGAPEEGREQAGVLCSPVAAVAAAHAVGPASAAAPATSAASGYAAVSGSPEAFGAAPIAVVREDPS